MFSFHDTPTSQISTLSLPDALPISQFVAHLRALEVDAAELTDPSRQPEQPAQLAHLHAPTAAHGEDRKSTRLNSSHTVISYAVFCLKKKTTHAILCPPPSHFPQRHC